MIELTAPPAELAFTLQITRAATGETETVHMVGHIQPQTQAEPQPQGDR